VPLLVFANTRLGSDKADSVNLYSSIRYSRALTALRWLALLASDRHR